MVTHEQAVAAFTRAMERVDSKDARIMYMAATRGIPDGSLALAVDMAAREVYKPPILQSWKRGGREV